MQASSEATAQNDEQILSDSSRQKKASTSIMKFAKKTSKLLRKVYNSAAVKKSVKRQKWKRLLRLLKKRNPKLVKKTSKTGATLLHRAVSHFPPLDVVQALYESKPDMILKCDIFGRSPLHEACRFHASFEVVEFLMKKSADAIYTRDKLGRNPLHYSLDTGFGYHPLKVDVIFLIMGKAPWLANAPDKKGETPFDCLVRSGSRKEVKFLVNALHPVVAPIDIAPSQKGETLDHEGGGMDIPRQIRFQTSPQEEELPGLPSIETRLQQLSRMISSGNLPSKQAPYVPFEQGDETLPGLDSIDKRLRQLVGQIETAKKNGTPILPDNKKLEGPP
jgi:hypothetical protein